MTSLRLIAGLVGPAAAVVLGASVWAYGLGSWEAVTVLAAAAYIAESRPMPISRRIALTVVFVPIVLAAVLFGPGAGALVGLVAMLADRAGPVERFVIYGADRILEGAAAGFGAVIVQHALGRGGLPEFLAAALLAAVAFSMVDTTFVMLVMRMRWSMRAAELWGLLRGSLMMTMALYVPLTALYGFVYDRAGFLVLAFLAIPLLAAHLSHSMFARQGQLIEQLKATNTQLEDANLRLRRVNLSFAAAMVRALDARDTYTAGHSAAVAVYSRDIAREVGLTAADVELVHLTGLVHDIGKIGLRAEVLQKTAALDDDEWAEMRRHSEIGATILVEVEDYAEVARIVRSHHERFDGAGYPDGLVRDQIPRLARVIAVADSYNAMTSDRPYRKAMPPEVAMKQLELGKGSQFEPELVDAFLAVLERETEPYRLGVQADFSLEAMQHPALLGMGTGTPVLRAAVA